MRQGQQNRRGRGRGGSNSSNSGNNHRKTQNPLSRNYESSGPDVKIRGTAAQIAEKYTALSRDALSSGDMVMAENYLQHAEHYNRIIMAAQAANAQTAANANADAGTGMNGAQRPPREANQNLRDQPQPHIPSHPGSEPQPVIAEQGQPKTEAAEASAEKPQVDDAQPAAETANAAEGNGGSAGVAAILRQTEMGLPARRQSPARAKSPNGQLQAREPRRSLPMRRRPEAHLLF
ncbi:MAG: DUF4167 domain-containing protein [Hyphomicrobiales bacterium]|nr:DUF4167 domain-containing protein [Hyphomicrobiales bacterium]